jgi:hypothetical protein
MLIIVILSTALSISIIDKILIANTINAMSLTPNYGKSKC